MGLEKMEMTKRSSEIMKENPDLKLVSAQLDEAIKKEDFEQAAVDYFCLISLVRPVNKLPVHNLPRKLPLSFAG